MPETGQIVEINDTTEFEVGEPLFITGPERDAPADPETANRGNVAQCNLERVDEGFALSLPQVAA